MGTKMAIAFANIFMAKVEKEMLGQSSIKPIFWKRFINDIIIVWDTSRNEIKEFLLKTNNFHPTIKFTALSLLRTNSSEITFEENMSNFSTRLKNRHYLATTVAKHLSEVIFADREKALELKKKNARKEILCQYVTHLENNS